MDKKQHARLIDLLSRPTAPFRETHIVRYATAMLEGAAVPYFEDAAGNIVVGAGSEREYLKRLRARASQPLRLFVAHMDHPGFHGQRWLADDRLAVRWYGGSPVRHLRGARVRIASDDGVEGVGTMVGADIARSGRAIARAEIRVAPGFARDRRRRPGARALFGGFDFGPAVHQARGRIHCPAADDLVGVFAILETARAVTADGRGAEHFLGLLTRGEEVGFVGAIAHFELDWLRRRRRPLVAVSLEASRTLPGAEIGKGPVVRLGDRRTVFDADGMQVLSELAGKVLPGRHQRRIMDGGACEATAATAFGIPTIGLTVPLGNYHNQGLEGGADCPRLAGPAPEFVHVDDVRGLLALCRALVDRPLCWDDPWGAVRARLQRNRRAYARHLDRDEETVHED